MSSEIAPTTAFVSRSSTPRMSEMTHSLSADPRSRGCPRRGRTRRRVPPRARSRRSRPRRAPTRTTAAAPGGVVAPAHHGRARLGLARVAAGVRGARLVAADRHGEEAWVEPRRAVAARVEVHAEQLDVRVRLVQRLEEEVEVRGLVEQHGLLVVRPVRGRVAARGVVVAPRLARARAHVARALEDHRARAERARRLVRPARAGARRTRRPSRPRPRLRSPLPAKLDVEEARADRRRGLCSPSRPWSRPRTRRARSRRPRARRARPRRWWASSPARGRASPAR